MLAITPVAALAVELIAMPVVMRIESNSTCDNKRNRLNNNRSGGQDVKMSMLCKNTFKKLCFGSIWTVRSVAVSDSFPTPTRCPAFYVFIHLGFEKSPHVNMMRSGRDHALCSFPAFIDIDGPPSHWKRANGNVDHNFANFVENGEAGSSLRRCFLDIPSLSSFSTTNFLLLVSSYKAARQAAKDPIMFDKYMLRAKC